MSDGGPGFSIAIMAKAPIVGYAKTRLIPLLGPAGAARAQREFILRTLGSAVASGPRTITLWCAPEPRQRFFRALRRSPRWLAHANLVLATQPDGGLGERMSAIFTAHGRSSPPGPAAPLLLIGTDCPVLQPAHLQQAAAALGAGADVVLGPVEDGGYVLVGLREPGRAAFLSMFERIDWSTDRVLAQTRQRLRAAGARWHELPVLWDVDEPADWRRWQQVRRTAG